MSVFKALRSKRNSANEALERRSQSGALWKPRSSVAVGLVALAAAIGLAACGSKGGNGGFGDTSSGGNSSSGIDTSSGSGGPFSSGGNSSGSVMLGSSGGSNDDSGATTSMPIPTMLPAFVRDDTGSSGVPAATIAQLKTGSSSCTAGVVYPYPLTMFPAEGLPPVIQWTGNASAAYIKMTYGNTSQVLYEAATGASNPGSFQIPQIGWTAVSIRSPAPPAPRTPLLVTLSTMSGSTVSTCQLKWFVAAGTFSGSIYYNSYDDPAAAALLGGAAGTQGSVMRLEFGAPKPEIFLLFTGPPAPMSGTGPCISCHSVSAGGNSLVATYHDYTTYGTKEFKVFAYDIAANPKPEPPKLYSSGIQSATFGALTPDGKYLLTMGNPQCTAGAETYPRAPNNFVDVEGPVVAKLWNVETGVAVAAQGLNPDYYMWMPQFSRTGTKIVFNHAKPGANSRTDRRSLATMDFDEATLTFSNLQVLYQDDGPAPSLQYAGYSTAAGAGTIATGAGGCTQNVQPMASTTFMDTCTDVCYPGWPFFTPDGNKVIFVRGTEPDFAGIFPGTGRYSPSISKLYIVDVTTKKAHELANANAGVTSQDLGYDYFSTVMPVASGGQFWALYTSRRTYGNTKYAGLAQADSKRIWVSAIDIGASDSVDPSHPPFYLGGQGVSGNLRAFPVLNPCKGDGATCSSGLDCCGGSCIGESGAGTCGVRPAQMCAMLNDSCTKTSDCCDKSQLCLGGVCSLPPPPQ